MCSVASAPASENARYVAMAGPTDEATAAAGRSCCLRSRRVELHRVTR
jgi:hypothetical protein